MFDKYTDHDIENALNELIKFFGLKEDAPYHDLFTLLQRKQTEQCVQEIASILGLPIRVKLSYVSRGSAQTINDRFQSEALVRNHKGYGTAGITAQVTIPDSLPMFGSAALRDLSIPVRISEDCVTQPESFVTIMAHELSHVLMASVRHPNRDSELHTDLIPILMGFRDVVQRGRIFTTESKSGNTTTTNTTTYGYLTDRQFRCAHTHITGILVRHRQDKARLMKTAEQIRSGAKDARQKLAAFRDHFAYLDRHPPKKMQKGDAQRMIQHHAKDYGAEWNDRITSCEEIAERAESFTRRLVHYTGGATDQMMICSRELGVATDQLAQLQQRISLDERMLRKYVGFFYKLWRTQRKQGKGPGG